MTDERPDRAGDGLYALPLDQFVAARKALADALNKQGDKGTARAVKALPKPAFPAWVTNQTVRRAPDLVEQLLRVTDALADAQRALGRTGNSQDRFREATAEQRRVVGELASIARNVLAEAGHADDGAVLEKVENNLRWSPISPEVRDQFQAGRLVRDVSAPGFSVFAGAPRDSAGDPSASVRSADPVEAGQQAPSSRTERTVTAEAGGSTAATTARDVTIEAREQVRAAAAAEAERRRQHHSRVEALEVELRRARAEAARAGQEHEVRQASVRKHAARVNAAEAALTSARADLTAAEAAEAATAKERAGLDEKCAQCEDRLKLEQEQT